MAARLHRTLNLAQLTFYGVGTIVGAGIYTIVGAAAGVAGQYVWVSVVLASFAAFITALSYAELVSAFPRAGAEYHFLKQGFPGRRLPPFLAGYLIALNTCATAATVALAFAGYLRVFVPVPDSITALVLLALCTAVNIAGIRQSTWVSIALICVEVGGLLLLIAAGLWQGDAGRVLTMPATGDIAPVFAATALVFFIYIGFEDVANLSEEARRPVPDVARALLISVVVTSIIYLLVVWAVLSVIEPDKLARSDSPLTTAADTVAPWVGRTLAVTALFATASTALIALISISRLLYGMARDRSMPASLATLSRRKTPWIAALALFAGACALLPLGEVKIIASISSFGILLVFIGVQGALIMLRYRKPTLKRGFRVPFAIGKLPILPVAGIAISVALVTQFDPIVYAVGAAAIAFGVLVYLFTVPRRARGTSRRRGASS